MTPSPQQLHDELAHFIVGHDTNVVAVLRDLTARKGQGVIGAPLLLGFGSRETDLHNIVGDGGHGRGWLQQDDRWQTDWLRHQPGCRSGTNVPVKGHSALGHGFVPTILAGAERAVSVYVGNYVFVRRQGFDPKTTRRIVVSSWNAGLTGALNGQRRFGNSDHFTTGGNYAADTLARSAAFVQLLKAIK